MCTLTVNNKPYTFPETISLAHLLQELQLVDRTGIAVAVNETVIPRDQWASLTLANQDQVLIVKASQGG